MATYLSGEADIQKVLQGLMVDNWGGLTPVQYDNTDIPTNSREPYVRMYINFGATTEGQFGNGFIIERSFGFIQFDIFIPEHSGTLVLAEICDKLRDIYRFYSKDYLRVNVPNQSQPPFSVENNGTGSGFLRKILGFPYECDIQRFRPNVVC